MTKAAILNRPQIAAIITPLILIAIVLLIPASRDWVTQDAMRGLDSLWNAIIGFFIWLPQAIAGLF